MSWFLILLLIGLGLLFPTAYAAKIGAPYVPAHTKPVRKTFSCITIGEQDVFIDLGAGDGKLVLAAAEKGAQARGYELSPIMWVIAWARAQWWSWRNRGKKKPQIYLRNFYTQNLTDATILYAFLLPQNMERLKNYLAKQRLPKARYMLVYAFPFKNVAPLQVLKEEKCLPMYIYDLKELTQRS